jgi:uncharacterized protein
MGVTDCHVHINPVHQMLPAARAIFGSAARTEVEPYLSDPARFLSYLDDCGVDRAVLVNYVAPDVVGYTDAANDFVSEFASHDPQRLIAVGGLMPSHPDPGARVRELVTGMGIRGIKIHPPHQLIAPNGYLDGTAPGLRAIYTECERLHVPVIVHTGTSVFPRARNRFAHPMLVEDVAIDFPELRIVLAHGGRPLWMDEAVFLVRRFPNVYLELSSIPPARLLTYFPRLEELAGKTLFGSDWPGPGVPDIGENLRAFQALGLSESARERILVTNPETIFPRATP